MQMAEINYYIQRDLRRQRIFLDRNNPLESLSDSKLIENYRLPRIKIIQLVNLCRDQLERATKRNHALPVHIQILLTLRFYAKGLFQKDVTGIHGISQPAVSKTIHAVTATLCAKGAKFIKFPSSDEDVLKVKQGFYSLCQFPNVIGAIDGTLIPIQAPSGITEPLYVGRKGGHSLNIQVVCDSKMVFLDVVAKWPGATHDSFIWRNSGLKGKFMNDPPNGWLVGDSGYPCEPWLMTPLEHPTTNAQKKFNNSLTKTRRIVENAIGLWKSIFRRIDQTGGRMIYHPKRACKIIFATAILHNIRRSLRLRVDEDFEIDEFDPIVIEPNLEENAITAEGVITRTNLVLNHFT